MIMIPESAFIRVTDEDSLGSLENCITQSQQEHQPIMKAWEACTPLLCTQTIDGPTWKTKETLKLVIPPNPDLFCKIMKEWHNLPTAGHPGRDETVRCITNQYHWPGAHQWIESYIKGCATCQQNKNLTHRTRTPLYCITVLPEAQPFEQIAMDLITGLPKSKGYDAILTIMDHGCSRAAIFLPCHITTMGLQIAQLYLNHIYKWFGLPKRIISDRDPRFTSHFSRSLAKELGIKWNLSSTAHPQMDRLSKRKNQWIEQFLCLITTNQQHWSKYLAIATLVHNNLKNTSTGYAPSKLLIGWEPPLTPRQMASTNNQLAERTTEQL
jgi:hypothetical protein